MPPTRHHFRKYDRWVAHRRQFIGASESPILLGYGYANSSRLSLYANKVGGEPTDAAFSDAQIESMRIGLAVEGGLMTVLQEKLDIKIKAQGRTTYLSGQIPFVGATPDGLTGQDEPVEVKNVGSFMVNEWDDGKTPLAFLIQLQHQIYVMEADHGYIAANLANAKLAWRKVDRDQTLIDLMLREMREFWEDHVAAKVPPDPDASQECRSALALLYPQSQPLTIVELPGKAIDLLEDRSDAKELEKTAEGKIAAAENPIKAAMGHAAYAILPDAQIVKWATQEIKAKECPHCGGEVSKPYKKRPFTTVKKLPKGQLTYVEPHRVPGLTHTFEEGQQGIDGGEAEDQRDQLPAPRIDGQSGTDDRPDAPVPEQAD